MNYSCNFVEDTISTPENIYTYTPYKTTNLIIILNVVI